MIPKVIHYCWFGKQKKSKLIKECILSWKQFLPDYEIIEWNETNCDFSSSFIKNAYKCKKWAFVADYIRLKILYEKGGIYLDTDMMVVKSFDSLLREECFLGAEDENYINCAVIGSKKNNAFIKECISRYELININFQTNWSHITIPKVVTSVFRERYNYGLPFNQLIATHDLVIFPINYFYPLPHNKRQDNRNYENYLAVESFAVHLWSSSWVTNSEFQDLRNAEYRIGFGKVFDKLKKDRKLNSNYIRKLLSALKESFYFK